jgi:flagellar protein FlaG
MATDISSILNVGSAAAPPTPAAPSPYGNAVVVPAAVQAHKPQDRQAGQDQAGNAGLREQVRAQLKATNSDLRFETDEETGNSIISIVDAETGKVIRQIPGEERIRLAQVLNKLAKGEVEDTA